MRRRFNYLVGTGARRFGYEIVRSERVPKGNLNLLELAFYALKARRHGPYRIVQVGAFDGVHNDPLMGVLKDPDVLAILLEPQEGPFEELSRRYAGNDRIILENRAIGTTTGAAVLHVSADSDGTPTASLLSEHSDNFGQRSLKRIEVEAISSRDLLTKHGWRDFDLLQVDAEGADMEIAMSFFALGIYPTVVNIETFHLNPLDRQCYRARLKEAGYQFQDWGFDTVAVRSFSPPEIGSSMGEAERALSRNV